VKTNWYSAPLWPGLRVTALTQMAGTWGNRCWD